MWKLSKIFVESIYISSSQTGVRGPFGTAKQFQRDREGNVKSSTVVEIFLFYIIGSLSVLIILSSIF